jgi:2-polyprenyl-3-methyl-5-hydroxy-6-metoxy-1,4-benzoquinol methylase
VLPRTTLGSFDLVLCQHVLEHVVDPIAAVRTLHGMLRPGGHLVVVTPFLVKIHNDPIDLWRFTPDGMERLLRTAGFTQVEIGAWGNAIAAAANLRIFVRDAAWVRWLGRWTRSSNPATPVAVWAFARR